MSDLLYILRNEKNEYYRLKDSFHQAAGYLLKSYDSLEIPATIEGHYKIDGNVFGNYNIKNCRDQILKDYRFLLGKADMEIDTQIRKIDNEIRAEEKRIEEERIEEERRRQEEERLKKEQEAKKKKMASIPSTKESGIRKV